MRQAASQDCLAWARTIESGAMGIGFVIPAVIALATIGWYVGVVVLLVKIWKKVKHLPG